MKTSSSRVKREECKQASAKEKGVFKLIQVSMSLILNVVIFYFFLQQYLVNDVFIRMVEVFISVLFIMLFTNGLSLVIVILMYCDTKASRFVMMEGSYSKFFFVTLIYSLIAALAFSFGAFWVIYSAFGDGTIWTLVIAYAIMYVICDFFAYGFVTYFYNLSRPSY